MLKGFFNVPKAVNEPVKSYAPGTPERAEVQAMYQKLYNQTIDVPLYIGAQEIRTGNTQTMSPPHDHKHSLGVYHQAEKHHVEQAIEVALQAREKWATIAWEQRAAIFLRAADLLTGPYRAKINAATMLAQSKNIYQAEIDAACELIDFLRFNVEFMTKIYADQPQSNHTQWNRVEYRPLEGFVYAITPFNFTAIAGNLPTSAALMGNVVVWKPAATQMYSANVLMDVFKEAGLPDGVINLVAGNSAMISDVLLSSKHLAGVHFTGSTAVFNSIWNKIGSNINHYKTYPRIVGETGGKDFIIAHPSAKAKQVSTAITRGAFEYQGQKCSAASRAYLPDNLAAEIKKKLVAEVKTMKMGSTENFSNFVNAVIDEKAFNTIKKYIDGAKKDKRCKILVGGKCDSSKGWFIEPTIIETTDPKYTTMCEEIFGPVLTIYTYAEKDFDKACELVDSTSDYALTGAVFSQDRYALEKAMRKLTHAAGNFYINDKPTGAVVGQQPFGGGRASGTNDKAGSMLNLYRWLSARTIKETFNPPVDYRYPFLSQA